MFVFSVYLHKHYEIRKSIHITNLKLVYFVIYNLHLVTMRGIKGQYLPKTVLPSHFWYTPMHVTTNVFHLEFEGISN